MKRISWLARLTLPFLFFVIAGAAQAQTAAGDSRIYIAPSISYDLIDKARGADNGLGMKFSTGIPLMQSLVAEFSLFGGAYASSNGDLSIGGGLLDGLYFYRRQDRMAHFVVLGAGLIRSTLNNDAVTNVMSNVGWGIVYRFDERISMRSDIRYRLESSDAGSRSDWLMGVGFVVPIGNLPE